MTTLSNKDIELKVYDGNKNYLDKLENLALNITRPTIVKRRFDRLFYINDPEVPTRINLRAIVPEKLYSSLEIDNYYTLELNFGLPEYFLYNSLPLFEKLKYKLNKILGKFFAPKYNLIKKDNYTLEYKIINKGLIDNEPTMYGQVSVVKLT